MEIAGRGRRRVQSTEEREGQSEGEVAVEASSEQYTTV